MLVARAWGLDPRQLVDVDAATYRAMIRQLHDEAVQHQQNRQ